MAICVVLIAVKWTAPRFDEESLRGARVVVTGASTGIGEQLAYHYARFGAQIVITARREKVLQQVAEKCLSLGAQKALYIAADMSSESDPEKVVDFALEKLGGLDYLVLNHIGPSPFTVWQGDVEHTKWLMQTSLTVDSYTGKTTSPFVAPYSSTKSALNGFFGSLYHELAMKKSNVSVSLCTLGLIDTEAAMDKVREVVNLPAYPATDAALNIIIIGATRQLELYYPWYTYIIVVTKDWFPSITNYIVQNSYNYIP
ncbi:Hydroxysteroid 11-beta-dehydrogenase 1-like protein [Takifugu flavidus]|uniref:Hydroxysteroid 11-beta-dehydrogenase 1-like protein n=1 Tax=Takifugu flavidus TaxID=433684 RepID=A0A5C6MSG1_9TELE|nr:Hydroxysteroid 11-beta-dehydrogenase 1-like protein [Takifugu flavidus]